MWDRLSILVSQKYFLGLVYETERVVSHRNLLVKFTETERVLSIYNIHTDHMRLDELSLFDKIFSWTNFCANFHTNATHFHTSRRSHIPSVMATRSINFIRMPNPTARLGMRKIFGNSVSRSTEPWWKQEFTIEMGSWILQFSAGAFSVFVYLLLRPGSFIDKVL